MKYLVYLIAFLFFVSCSQRVEDAADYDQIDEHEHSDITETDIPDVVIKAFETKYPDAQDVEWEKEANAYEAEFEVGDTEYEAEFDNAGNWLATEREIKLSDLPAAVVLAVNNNYPGFEIEEAEMMDTPDFTGVYELEIEKQDKEMEIIIDAAGNVLKEMIEYDDNDDDDDDNG